MTSAPYRVLNRYASSAFITVAILVTTATVVALKPTDAVAQKFENKGFVTDPPAAWKQRFPMCQEYLNVEWIDQVKRIGYSSYEIWSKGEKKVIWALVALDAPGFDYDVYQYRRAGKLDELFSAVKYGKVTAGHYPLTIKFKSKTFSLYPVPTDYEPRTLTNFQQTVCVVFPNQQRAWIVDGKKIDKIYTERRIDEMFRYLEIFVPDLAMRSFKDMIVVDLNFDGVDDYIQSGWAIYSFGDKYFYMMRGDNLFEHGHTRFPFSFPPTGKVCKLSSWTGSFLITDGNSYILNEECNLTVLTRPSADVKREGKRPAELDIPEEARQFGARIDAAFKANDNKSAVNLLDKTIEIAPWWADAHFQRAMALADLNKYGAAIHDMRLVQAISGDTPAGSHARNQIQSWQEPLRRLAVGQMVEIPAGRFLMGSPISCNPGRGWLKCEQPQHWVEIKRFEIGKYPVTYDQWEACVEDGGCDRRVGHVDRWGWGDLPANSINWENVQAYLSWIKEKTGMHYRLPSEAEWEYAARAGKSTTYYWGDDIGTGHANCAGCGSQSDGKSTSPVGSFAPNAFGLYDMAGNVWQWLDDCEQPDYRGAPTDGSSWIAGNCRARIIRGGSYRDNMVRPTDRRTEEVQFGPDNVGFRLARSLD